MRVLVIFNPISGAGRAADAAHRLANFLSDRGIDANTAPTQRDHPSKWLDDALHGCDALIVVGGDGAVRIVADTAARNGTAIYQYPMGTENLFARQFGMSSAPDRIADAIRAGRTLSVDLGNANDETFTLMASVGFDADVVHDLDGRRTGAITRWNYVAAIARQLCRWSYRPITVTVDGEPIGPAAPAPAMVVIANSRQYGMRLDPARDASMTDGLLDLVYMPATRCHHIAGWAMRCRFGRHLTHPRMIYRRGRCIEIVADEAFMHQIDGDRSQTPPADQLAVTVRPSALRVLLPAAAD